MKTIITCLLFLVLTTSLVYAAETTSDFEFEVTLEGGCVITSNTNLTINYNTTQDEATSSFNVVHVCTPSLNYVFRLGNGLHSDAQLRRSKKDNDYVKYRLYWDNTYTDEAGLTSNNEKNLTGNGAQQTRTIYAKVTKVDNPTPASGTYTDTLRVTLTW